MPVLPNPRHEAFAQARIVGKSVLGAYWAAGYNGQKSSATKLSQRPEVQARIAELQEAIAAQTVCHKSQVVRDLIAIIHARPEEAGPDHPLCEVFVGRNGPYQKFPPKLQAFARLIKFMGWNIPPISDTEPEDTLRDLFIRIRSANKAKHSVRPPSTTPTSTHDSTVHASTVHASTVHSSTDHDPTNHVSPSPSSPPLSPRQEAFVQARIAGKSLSDAAAAAGYSPQESNASRLDHHPAVQARMAQLNASVSEAVNYRREDAISDLTAIIHAPPSAARPDHPLCEMRMSHCGPYHRFPSKLGAIILLARITGWEKPSPPPHDPDASLNHLMASIAEGK